MKDDPGGDYYILVSRAPLRPKVDVYAWLLRQRIPAVRIPLKPGDPEIVLDVQSILNQAYDRLRYSSTLDDTRPLRPPLSPADSAWLQERLAALRNPAKTAGT